MPRPSRHYYVCTTFLLRPTSSYFVLTTFLLCPYCVLIPPRPRHVSFFQNLTKTFTSIKTSLRPYYGPPMSYKTISRPYGVLKFLGRSMDVVRTWPSVDVHVILRSHMIKLILLSGSFHMKFFKLIEGSFNKFQMKQPRV